MSLWYCETHGLTGPMACCSRAGRASVQVADPPTTLTTTDPDSTSPFPATGGTEGRSTIPNASYGQDPRDATVRILRALRDIEMLASDEESAQDPYGTLDRIAAIAAKAHPDFARGDA